MQYEKDSRLCHEITLTNIMEFERFLYLEERSSNTIKKYMHDSQVFFNFFRRTWMSFLKA